MADPREQLQESTTEPRWTLMGCPLGRIVVSGGPAALGIGEEVEVVPAGVTDAMIQRAAEVLNAYRDSMELDEDLAELVLRAAVEVPDER